MKRSGPDTLEFRLRHVRGGKRYVMDVLAPWAMQFEPRLEPAIVRWAQLTPWQRRFVTLDDLAAGTDLTPGEFFGAVVRAAFEFTAQVAELIIGSAYPQVVQASVKRALTPEGIEDRLVLMQYMEDWAARQRAARQPREQAVADTTRELTFTEKIGAAAAGAQATPSTDAASPAESHPLPKSGRSPLGSIH